MKNIINTLYILIFFLSSHSVSGQLSIIDLTGNAAPSNVSPWPNGPTVENLLEFLIGEGVTVISETSNCDPSAIGAFFNGTDEGLSINNGIILSSGRVIDALGPNWSDGTTTAFGNPGDGYLDILSGNPTFDACILEFSFIPTGNNLSITYFFASEEYSEYVCTMFNDVFAFAVTGPDPAGGAYDKKNIALVPDYFNPDSQVPITINTINNGNPFLCPPDGDDCSECLKSNPNLFIDNDFDGFLDEDEQIVYTSPYNFEYDGFTVPLTAFIELIPGEQYTFFLGIADAGDGSLDSAVFLEEASFTSVSIDTQTTDSQEGCTPGSIAFSTNSPYNEDIEIAITVLGTSTASPDDYLPFDLTVILPANTTEISIPVISVADVLDEPTETIDFSYTFLSTSGAVSGNGNGTVNIFDSPVTCQNYTLEIDESGVGSIEPSDVLTGDLNACPGDLMTYTLSQSDFGFQDAGEHSITLEAVNNFGMLSSCIAIVTVTVSDAEPLNIEVEGTCATVYPGLEGKDCIELAISVSGGFQPYEYEWNTDDNTPSIVVCPLSPTSYLVTVTDASGTTAVSAPIEVFVIQIACMDVNLILDENGLAQISPEQFILGESDCPDADVTITVSQTTFSTDDIGSNTVILSVEDNFGNVNSCEFNVHVTPQPDPITLDCSYYIDENGDIILHSEAMDDRGNIVTCEVNIGPAGSQPCNFMVDLGDDCRDVYLGYAPNECTTIAATVNGGSGSYSYLWSSGQSGSSIVVCPNSTTDYFVTVTDSNGDVQVAGPVTVNVHDIRCGPGQNKVYICHQTSGSNSQFTLCVAPTSVPSHLAHGDHLGPCEIGSNLCNPLDLDMPGTNHLQINEGVFPNPGTNEIQIILPFEASGKVSLKMYSQTGILVNNLSYNEVQETLRVEHVNRLKNGIYFIFVQDESGNEWNYQWIKAD